MREIIVISGKGGTGKTSLTGALAALARNTILCDLDVDAPDLHLILQPEVQRREDFYSGHEARIDQEKCTACGICTDLCQFDAIQTDGQVYSVDPLRCEGCKVCVAFCPVEAIAFPERHCGQWFVSTTRFATLVHAQLFPGAENSGRLVMLLKQQARELARQQQADFILCDGAPGIGCPVISSLSGADLAVVVTEPTPSGRHDLERVVALCQHFHLATAVILNKYDLSRSGTRQIEKVCLDQGLELLARLPHDPVVTQAMLQGLVVTEMPANRFSRLLAAAWDRITALVNQERAAAVG